MSGIATRSRSRIGLTRCCSTGIPPRSSPPIPRIRTRYSEGESRAKTLIQVSSACRYTPAPLPSRTSESTLNRPRSPTAVGGEIERCGRLVGMKAYSVDLRKRVVAAVERGSSTAQVAQTFGIGLATVKRWVARRRRDPEDDLEPRKAPGQAPSITTEQHPRLCKQLESNPTATVAEHARLWNEAHQASVSQWTLGRAIRRLGWTRKKGVWDPPNGTRRRGSSTGRG